MSESFIVLAVCGLIVWLSICYLLCRVLGNVASMNQDAMHEASREVQVHFENLMRLIEKQQAATPEQRFQTAKMHAQERVNKVRSDERVDALRVQGNLGETEAQETEAAHPYE
jgi:hypothetical protein